MDTEQRIRDPNITVNRNSEFSFSNVKHNISTIGSTETIENRKTEINYRNVKENGAISFQGKRAQLGTRLRQFFPRRITSDTIRIKAKTIHDTVMEENTPDGIEIQNPINPPPRSPKIVSSDTIRRNTSNEKFYEEKEPVTNSNNGKKSNAQSEKLIGDIFIMKKTNINNQNLEKLVFDELSTSIKVSERENKNPQEKINLTNLREISPRRISSDVFRIRKTTAIPIENKKTPMNNIKASKIEFIAKNNKFEEMNQRKNAQDSNSEAQPQIDELGDFYDEGYDEVYYTSDEQEEKEVHL